MRFWFAVVFVLGASFAAGVVLTVVDLLALRPAPAPSAAAAGHQ